MSTEPGSSAPTIAGLLAIARVEFQHAFSARPAAAAAAPGRVNLIGDHVDYCGGLVLPIAINRHTVVCAGVSPSRGHAGTMRVVSHGRPGVHRVAAAAACASIEPYWVRYPAGVLAMLRDRGLLAVEVGVDLAIASSVPEGAGLSSSAALEVATCLAIEQLARGPGLDSRGRALLAQSAEHEYAGVPCGIMDQYVAVFAREGAALLIDCESLTHRHVHVPEGVQIVVVDSGVKHELAAAGYAERRRECERGLGKIAHVVAPRASLRHVSRGDLEAAIVAGAPISEIERCRVRHVLTEIARTSSAAAALDAGDLRTVGRLMDESHVSLREDYAVSCDAVDAIVERLRRIPGVLGARMTGGGFGGCVVALVDGSAADGRSEGLLYVGGRSVFMVRPSGGAAVLELGA